MSNGKTNGSHGIEVIANPDSVFKNDIGELENLAKTAFDLKLSELRDADKKDYRLFYQDSTACSRASNGEKFLRVRFLIADYRDMSEYQEVSYTIADDDNAAVGEASVKKISSGLGKRTKQQIEEHAVQYLRTGPGNKYKMIAHLEVKFEPVNGHLKALLPFIGGDNSKTVYQLTLQCGTSVIINPVLVSAKK